MATPREVDMQKTYRIAQLGLHIGTGWNTEKHISNVCFVHSSVRMPVGQTWVAVVDINAQANAATRQEKLASHVRDTIILQHLGQYLQLGLRSKTSISLEACTRPLSLSGLVRSPIGCVDFPRLTPSSSHFRVSVAPLPEIIAFSNAQGFSVSCSKFNDVSGDYNHQETTSINQTINGSGGRLECVRFQS